MDMFKYLCLFTLKCVGYLNHKQSFAGISCIVNTSINRDISQDTNISLIGKFKKPFLSILNIFYT